MLPAGPRRHHCAPFDPFALAGEQQSKAVITQHTRPVGITDYTDKVLDEGRNAGFIPATGQRIYHNVPYR